MQKEPINLRIRKAKPDDAAHVANVFNAAFKPLRSIYCPTGDAIKHQAERAEEGTRLVAEIEGRIVGTVQFDDHKKHIHVIGLAVHPDFQRIGVARGMIEWVLLCAPTLGHSVVALDTIKETGNVLFFEKMGFQVVHEEIATWCTSDDHTRVHNITMEQRVV